MHLATLQYPKKLSQNKKSIPNQIFSYKIIKAHDLTKASNNVKFNIFLFFFLVFLAIKHKKHNRIRQNL